MSASLHDSSFVSGNALARADDKSWVSDEMRAALIGSAAVVGLGAFVIFLAASHAFGAGTGSILAGVGGGTLVVVPFAALTGLALKNVLKSRQQNLSNLVGPQITPTTTTNAQVAQIQSTDTAKTDPQTNALKREIYRAAFVGNQNLHFAKREALKQVVDQTELNKIDAFVTKLAEYSDLDCSMFGKVAERGDREMVQEFIAIGVDVNIKDHNAEITPLHGAVLGGKIEVVELLLKSGANINAQNFVGKTPLYHAVERLISVKTPQEQTEALEIIRVLIADPKLSINEHSNKNWTPYNVLRAKLERSPCPAFREADQLMRLNHAKTMDELQQAKSDESN